MSDRRVLIALLCSILIVSSGCVSITSNDAEPTSPPTTEPATTTTAPEQLAPGLATNGVTDAEVLADAHQAALEGEPFVRHTSKERSNAAASVSKRTTFYYANDSHHYSIATSEGLPVDFYLINGTVEMYSDENVVLKRRQTADNVSYSVIEIAPSDLLSERVYSHSLVYMLFAESDVTVEDSGGALTRVTGTDDKLWFGDQIGTSIEFTATVTNTGLVQSLNLTYQQGNDTVKRSLSFEETDENPVEQPDWYETALNQTQVNET